MDSNILRASVPVAACAGLFWASGQLVWSAGVERAEVLKRLELIQYKLDGVVTSDEFRNYLEASCEVKPAEECIRYSDLGM